MVLPAAPRGGWTSDIFMTYFRDRERRGTWAWFSVNHDGLQRIRSILDPAPRASCE